MQEIVKRVMLARCGEVINLSDISDEFVNITFYMGIDWYSWRAEKKIPVGAIQSLYLKPMKSTCRLLTWKKLESAKTHFLKLKGFI